VYIHTAVRKTVAIVGDSKLNYKWKSKWLAMTKLSNLESMERIWPLRQLATYCHRHHTRYGFIVTEEEVVVLRVADKDKSAKERHFVVEYKAVPWTEEGENKLTGCLAIWFLACLGFHENERSILQPGAYQPLSRWKKGC